MLQTQVHETGAKLLFADPADGLQPYLAVAERFEAALESEGSFTAAGETWRLNHDEGKLSSWQGKIAARETDPFDAFPEFNIGVVAEDPVGRRRINFQFRPALPEAAHIDTGEPIGSLPDDLPEGVRVQVDAANVHPEDALAVLRALAAFLDIDPALFARQKLHDWSRVYNAAVYVRLDREVSEEHITSRGALMDRLARLQCHRAGQGMYQWDNEEIIGHRTAVALNETALEELYRGDRSEAAIEHSMGKLLKSYHMADPDAQDGHATEHAKLEVQWSTEFSRETSRPFAAVDDVLRELDAHLVNALAWADLPLAPDPAVYVPDEYFSLEERSTEEAPPICPARVEDVIDHREDVATTALLDADATESEREALAALVADGGEAHYETLAETAGVSTSTVYRMVDRFEAVLETVRGEIRTADEVVQRRLSALLDQLSQSLSWVERGLSALSQSRDEPVDPDSAFGRWARRYGVQVVASDGISDDRLTLKVQVGQYTRGELAEVIRAGWRAAGQVGTTTQAALRDALVAYTTPSGQHRRDRAVVRDGTQLRAVGRIPLR